MNPDEIQPGRTGADGEPCQKCLPLALAGVIDAEMVQPLTPCGPIDLDRQRICHDCAAAGTVLRFRGAPSFDAARQCVGSDRSEQLRLPGAPMGLVALNIMRPSTPGDFERHMAWLDAHNWFGTRPEERTVQS